MFSLVELSSAAQYLFSEKGYVLSSGYPIRITCSVFCYAGVGQVSLLALSFVLSNAPCLLDWPESVSCALQCTTSECLSTGSNLVCAH